MLSGLNVGSLDDTIVIESETEAKNSIGENEKTWSTLTTVSARWKFKNFAESFEGKQETGGSSAEIWLRYNSSIDSTMRLKRYGETDYYYIRDVQSWQREGFTKIMAIKRDNQ